MTYSEAIETVLNFTEDDFYVHEKEPLITLSPDAFEAFVVLSKTKAKTDNGKKRAVKKFIERILVESTRIEETSI